jgi:hypothetical protein
MIARKVEDASSLADLAQQLLDDVVVLLRPIPAAVEAPSVQDVTHEVKPVAFGEPQKIQEQG